MSVQNQRGIREMDHNPLGTALERAASEIATGAKALSALQWTISTLLEKLHHPDLAAEVQMLQDIDRLHQTYIDLAAMIEISAKVTDKCALPEDDMKRVMKLDSLKTRIFDLGPEGPAGPDEEEITWF